MLVRCVLAAAIAASAATGPAPQPAPPKRPPVDCRDERHRSIGFWIGDWNVSDTASATPIAQSRIEWLYDGCAIKESFTQTVGPNNAPIDYRGTSYTAYDALDGVWRQFYLDSRGALSRFSGTLDQSTLVLTARGGPVTNRMTVNAQPDGSVRQRGEFSTDDGATWNAGYDFTYRRR